MDLRGLYELLASQVVSDGWWPAQSRFEIVVGAVLTQNTNWGNVDKALENLREAGVLSPRGVMTVELEYLAELIRPAGYFNTKSRYLKAVSEWFSLNDHGAHGVQTEELRQSLLQVKGIGGETADDILLYVYDRPVFIYDLYARRLLEAASFGAFRTYEHAKKHVDPLVDAAGLTVPQLAHFHGLIVDAGKIARTHGGWNIAYGKLVNRTF